MIFLTEGDSAGGSMVQAATSTPRRSSRSRASRSTARPQARHRLQERRALQPHARARHRGQHRGLRYNKVILATDADVDGMHIRNLLLTYFLRFFEELVQRGHLYILETPLFRVRNKKETIYCYSEKPSATRAIGADQERRDHALQGPGRNLARASSSSSSARTSGSSQVDDQARWPRSPRRSSSSWARTRPSAGTSSSTT